MKKSYKILYQAGEGEIVEKKSRFIATIRPVDSEEEALSFIAEMRKKYWDATHNCTAFVIGETMSRCGAMTTASHPRRLASHAGRAFGGGRAQLLRGSDPVFRRHASGNGRPGESLFGGSEGGP